MPLKANDARIAKALSHPVRMRVLIALSEAVASPNELSKQLEESLGVVSYHVKQLEELDCIELVKTEQRRGAIEHYYRATTRPIFDEGWDQLPREARTQISSAVLSEIWRDVGRSLMAGSFDREPERHLSRTPLVLDRKGWDALNARLEALCYWALDQQAKAAGRIAKGAESMTSELVMMSYTTPGGDSTAGNKARQGRSPTRKSRGRSAKKAKPARARKTTRA
jgi:DNA-binding transcriptional ArsR family regulator